MSHISKAIETITELRRATTHANLWNLVTISRPYRSINEVLEALPVEKLQGDDWAHVRSLVMSYHYLYECNKNEGRKEAVANNLELMRRDRESLARFVASKFVERLQNY